MLVSDPNGLAPFVITSGVLTCTPRHLRSGQVCARCKCRKNL